MFASGSIYQVITPSGKIIVFQGPVRDVWYCERLWTASCYFFEELGEDIREGKITYPVTLARGSGQSSWPMLKMTCPEEFYKRMESCLSVGRGDEQVGKGEAKIRVEDAATENP